MCTRGVKDISGRGHDNKFSVNKHGIFKKCCVIQYYWSIRWDGEMRDNKKKCSKIVKALHDMLRRIRFFHRLFVLNFYAMMQIAC